ncbi:MAG: thioredoxin family protein [Lentisphaerae bacterium]|nr:thioredoxin family protein [Lentisphaerota bacterium]
MKSKWSRTALFTGLLGVLAGVVSAVYAAEAKPEQAQASWLTNFEQAQKQAKEQDRPILVNFSGSDWCGWCIRLDKEVLSQTEFKNYAKDNLVLFVADFPQQKKLPEPVAKQNQALLEHYGVQGFPTLLLLNAKGDVIARTGYQTGGAQAYVEHLAGLIAAGKDKPATTTGATKQTPVPYEYDAANDRYWDPGHGHWHQGKPPAGR